MARPRPVTDVDTEFFWHGVADGKVLIQRCIGCGVLRHPPRPICPECLSPDWKAEQASGRASLYSYAVQHYPPVPGFELPYIVALADLAEGVRLVANLTDCHRDQVSIGMALEVYCSEVEPGFWLPQFRPA